MYLQEQKLAKVEVEFAKAIGIPVNEKVNETASILNSLTSRMGNSTPKKRVSQQVDPDVGIAPSKLLMFRFITYLNGA